MQFSALMHSEHELKSKLSMVPPVHQLASKISTPSDTISSNQRQESVNDRSQAKTEACAAEAAAAGKKEKRRNRGGGIPEWLANKLSRAIFVQNSAGVSSDSWRARKAEFRNHSNRFAAAAGTRSEPERRQSDAGSRSTGRDRHNCKTKRIIIQNTHDWEQHSRGRLYRSSNAHDLIPVS